ncbi:AAA family ATPase [Candidatus Gracilibacteria bacterium]|nr:AAA family ATPase [Candidatus Gracilibacteria bacterium]
MINIGEFVSENKSLLTAPAGYGKTYTISACIKYAEDNKLGKQLILTHTHAGVISIKEKLKNNNVKSSSYNIETISSYIQKFVLAFYTGNDIPEQDSNDFHSFILEKATTLFTIKNILAIVSSTYTGLFVDEYQDCTLKQHAIIESLSSVLPTHILGDHMQGIFGFSDPLVDIEDDAHMGTFLDHRSELIEPRRRIIGNNLPLGEDLGRIRTLLENKQPINITAFPSITFYKTDSYLDNMPTIFNIIDSSDSLLFIEPQSRNIKARINFVQRVLRRCILIESIDSPDFYKLSKIFDSIDSTNAYETIKEAFKYLFSQEGITLRFNNKGIVNKREIKDKNIITPIGHLLETIIINPSFEVISEFLKDVSKLPNVKFYRKDLFYSICKCLEESKYKGITVYEAMKARRNNMRRIGRKIYGKCIGTTLLTKGLEFDTVVLLNAHLFDNPKDLYVALTRATKELIIFSNNPVLKPYH